MKYAGKRFIEMDDNELELSSAKILLVVHTLTGWSLPVDEFMDILSDQFKLKLKESYKNMNEKEFEYAFRNRSNEIKDWGKALNFSLIDEVIVPYLENRFELSRLEEQKKSQTLMLEQPQETIDVIDMIEDWRKNPDLNMLLIPLFFYDFLFDTGMIKITDAEKWDWWAKAKESVKSELISNLPTDGIINDAVRDWRTFTECESTNRWDMVTNGKIANRAKRLIVFDYLTKK